MAVVGAIALVGSGAYALTSGGGGGSCLTEAAEHFQDDDVGFVMGTDLERARAAGYDDSGSTEDIVESLRATGIIPDPVTQDVYLRFIDVAELSGIAGIQPGDISCWVGTPTSFGARGTFDAEAVEGSERGEEGELAATGQLLVSDDDGDAATRLEQQTEPDAAVGELLRALEARDVIGFSISFLDVDHEDDSRVPVAVAHTRGNEWELLVIWLFEDGDAAEEGQEAVTALIDEGASRISDIIQGDPVDSLDRDGSLLVLQAPLNEPDRWQVVLQILDPILDPLDDPDDPDD